MENDLWLKGAYYIDTDTPGQLRVIGPGNHLVYGAAGLYREDLQVIDVVETGTGPRLVVKLNPMARFLPDPAMGHIRRVRELTQTLGQEDRTFEEARRWHPEELMPTHISLEGEDAMQVTYLRIYGTSHYGTRWHFPPGTRLGRDDHRQGFEIETALPLTAEIELISRPLPEPYRGQLLRPFQLKTTPFTDTLLTRTGEEYEHLIRHHKTSGFDYGTVMPRDWMEAADLGSEDLEPEAIRHMYAAALQNVNEHGAGWHEDIVGEFRYEREQELSRLALDFQDSLGEDSAGRDLMPNLREFLDELFVSRNMIDIEPHYILGLQHIGFEDFDPDSQERLRRVAAFIVGQAQSRELITFNKTAAPFRRQSGDEYNDSGNWRDSTWAYKQVHAVIAPYDVNAVFYPQALRVIRASHQTLGLDSELVDALIRKWDRVKDWYKFTNDDGLTASALALYNVRTVDGLMKYDMLKVNHLDESYDHFYGQPTQGEVASFATRLLSPRYFYTDSGPILVGHGENFTTAYYHGKVTWTKQTAFVVAGLDRQLSRALSEHWPADAISLIRQAITTTARANLSAFRQLGAVPEVHYDDAGRARFYTDQPDPEGVMNKVQLWSTAGARRLLRVFVRNNKQ